MLTLVEDIPEGLEYKLQAERLIVVSNMRVYGGSFVKTLSTAIMRADAENYEKLKAAFPELWAQYANIKEADDEKTE